MVLHEFGHGLGFLSLTNNSTGTFPAMNEPDIWSYFLYDEGSATHWKDMTASARVASAVSGALAWDGPSVTQAVPETLAFPPLLQVISAPEHPRGGEGLRFPAGRVQRAHPRRRRGLRAARSGFHRLGLLLAGPARSARRKDRHPRPRRPQRRRLHLRREGPQRPGCRERSACSSPTTSPTRRSSPRRETRRTSTSRCCDHPGRRHIAEERGCRGSSRGSHRPGLEPGLRGRRSSASRAAVLAHHAGVGLVGVALGQDGVPQPPHGAGDQR